MHNIISQDILTKEICMQAYEHENLVESEIWIFSWQDESITAVKYLQTIFICKYLLMPETRQFLSHKTEHTTLKHLGYLHTFRCQIHSTSVYLTQNLCIWKWISSCRFYHLHKMIFYEAGNCVGLPVNTDGNKHRWCDLFPFSEYQRVLMMYNSCPKKRKNPLATFGFICICTPNLNTLYRIWTSRFRIKRKYSFSRVLRKT